MYRIKTVIQKTQTNDGCDGWALGFNAVNDTGCGRGKRISSLLPYVQAFETREEALQNLRSILNGLCPCLIDMKNRKFKRTAEEQAEDMSYFEWVEILS